MADMVKIGRMAEKGRGKLLEKEAAMKQHYEEEKPTMKRHYGESGIGGKMTRRYSEAIDRAKLTTDVPKWEKRWSEAAAED